MTNAAVKVISILIRGQDLSTFFNSEDLFVAQQRRERNCNYEDFRGIFVRFPWLDKSRGFSGISS
ncbi:hypothetical protein, partial [Turicimonas muris]|uniref:hypothetical protein n=1 Tax=Turicimonas muris TaxID=1796652 RepID=UPI00272C46D5